MKIIRIFTYVLILAGTTTVCLSAFHDTKCQRLTNLARTASLETPQQIKAYQHTCPISPSETLWVRTELFFGLSRLNGSQISERDFQKFFNQEVASRFPEGSTLISAQGQFRTAKGINIKEPARLLIVLYPIEQSNRRTQSIEQIRDAYKTAFQQESVLRLDDQSCISS
jgi:Protein of unknown function (DUF3574)